MSYVQLWNYLMTYLYFGPGSAALAILFQLPLIIWLWFSFDGQFGILEHISHGRDITIDIV